MSNTNMARKSAITQPIQNTRFGGINGETNIRSRRVSVTTGEEWENYITNLVASDNNSALIRGRTAVSTIRR